MCHGLLNCWQNQKKNNCSCVYYPWLSRLLWKNTHTGSTVFSDRKSPMIQWTWGNSSGTRLADEMRVAALLNSVHESTLFHRGPKASGDQWSNAYYRDFQLLDAPHRYFICIVTLVLCKKNAIPRILFIDDSTEKILRAEWSPSVRCQINHWNLTYCFR